ncbi:aminotransferase class V-fold PLP-dependent enzyme [Ekhidna sp.]|jgi:selenocysteine lyase/cysteine desulfurase|uniref:aminotransferase class V-fold PLP-dependent enzyme n=1 Tax=Ekhidna sp. TaxID=2608089 RepID=UPI0032EB69AD
MIYLNNAGTTWPKPEAVTEAIARFNELPPDQWLAVFEEGTQTVTNFFGISNPARFLFTQSCTQALTTAFSDFAWQPGDRLIMSTMEHHALSRWFYKLQQERGVEGVVIPRSNDGPFDLKVFEDELKKGARMVAISMASNVTGEILPYEDIIRLCKVHGAFCLLDGAQTAGIMPINISDLDPDIFVFAGHKGPFGTQGIGGLYLSERVSMTCPSAACEITPRDKTPSVFPTYCDIGSAPMMTIAGLTAGVKWIEEKGLGVLEDHRISLTKMMRNGLDNIEGIEIVGNKMHGRYTGAVSIVSETIPLKEMKERLKEHDIIGSLGFQCAPLAHEALGTSETGTFRLSVGPLNTEEEIEVLLHGIRRIIR